MMTLAVAAAYNDVDVQALGRRLRAARVSAGMTQPDVAGDVLSTAYLSRCEAGQRRPSPEKLEYIADRIGTTVEWLVLGEADEKPHPTWYVSMDLDLATTVTGRNGLNASRELEKKVRELIAALPSTVHVRRSVVTVEEVDPARL